MASAAFSVLLFLVGLLMAPTVGVAVTYGIDFDQRFPPAAKWGGESTDGATVRGGALSWLDESNIKTYAALQAKHDYQAIRGRELAGTDKAPLMFAGGNATFRIYQLGSLIYTLIGVGSPPKFYWVALLTGTDLSWIPCDCKSCSSTNPQNYGLSLSSKFEVYNPRLSTTSKKVACNSSYCSLRSQCNSTAGSSCPYVVPYSKNISSSGVLMEDLILLMTNDPLDNIINTPIIFGCGQVQTGDLLSNLAPNGVVGLGMGGISVPSTMARAGLVVDSFSMCFGPNAIGRLNFGDEGSSDQDETPLNVNPSRTDYNVTVTGIRVGNRSFAGRFYAVVRTGFLFTELQDPAYTTLTKNLDSAIPDQRIIPPIKLPFEYCYATSSKASLAPTASLLMSGGGEFRFTKPYLVYKDSTFYCLAIVKNREVNIIGGNTMVGHRIVFNREKKTLGWKRINCYDGTALKDDPDTLPVKIPNTGIAPSPGPAASPADPPASNSPVGSAEARTHASPPPSEVPVPASSLSTMMHSFRQLSLFACVFSIAVIRLL